MTSLYRFAAVSRRLTPRLRCAWRQRGPDASRLGRRPTTSPATSYAIERAARCGGRGRLSAPTVPAQLATAGEVAEPPANALVSSRSASTQTTGDPNVRRSQGGVGADGSLAARSTVKVPRTFLQPFEEVRASALIGKGPRRSFRRVAGELEVKFTPKLLDGVVVPRLAMLTKGPETRSPTCSTT